LAPQLPTQRRRPAAGLIDVERAIAEIRAGRPAPLRDGASRIIAAGIEAMGVEAMGEALAGAGLDVVSDHRLVGRKTAHNLRCLAAKRDRGGHFFDQDL